MPYRTKLWQAGLWHMDYGLDFVFDLSFGKSVHRLSSLEVEHGNAARVVRGHLHVDLCIDIEPFWMVVHTLGQKGCAAHKAKGLDKVCKGEAFP